VSEQGNSDSTVTAAQVLDALRVVFDPDLGRDIVSLGFVQNIKICGGSVAFDVELTTPACPVEERLKFESKEAVKALPGVENVSVTMTSQVRGRDMPDSSTILSGVKNIIAVASGKGGVGKSTCAVNLALALAQTGAAVGLLDGDVYGPSIPRLLGIREQPKMTEDEKLIPIEVHGIKAMSLGFLTGPDTPVIWRGPMATRLIQQFLGAVEWGDLDYLLIDLPPGTGDIQLTLVQSAPLTGAVIVTTPQDVAREISTKGLKMFTQVNVPILGIIENMSYFVCGHCDERTEIFRHGTVQSSCEDGHVPFLGEIPIDPELVLGGDEGMPIVVRMPESVAARAFVNIASNIAARLSTVHMTRETSIEKPTEIESGEGQLVISWEDGDKTVFPFRELRAACPCAQCVDEWTGERRVTASEIPVEVTLASYSAVGNYALAFNWSDGHSTGLYAFSYLKRLAETGFTGAKGTPPTYHCHAHDSAEAG